MRFASPVVAASLVATLVTGPALAQPKTFEAFATIAGEVGTARSSCGFDMDHQALIALGRPFSIGPSAGAAIDGHADAVAAGLARASERLQRQGEAAFCRDMLAAYGPGGRVAQGLLRPR